ncbi:apoptosis-stimulating of p53 protein 2-like isoform X1 [Takifugu rubripes]|uniref:Tumor protein p53 binding protein, 2b n=1 Tax=Takifugu rubripes TaxID=31033 RepID=H2TN31_TAKRU|nr:apoptosis-stimulating of p53 protein 2-like isoform X1 [Takifugu rubripes]|eukprot:XP_011610978.1 PREDICTED: apoptosis-stimulating of p53 protein 2-like isoform X1 [Takifugu rubripes]
MMPMFLTVYRSNNDQNISEVPIMPETLCRDVVEFCKEPGEGECYLAEMWQSSERMVGEREHMMEVLQQWGQHRGEVRYLLRHRTLPGPGRSRAADMIMKRNQMDSSEERSVENGASTTQINVTLSDLQDLATWQQQQINSQQHLLASKEQQLMSLKLQEQQELSEQEHLRQLRENAHNQEAQLQWVRALRGEVEQKRLSNRKLVEEIEQLSELFQQKQRELLLAVSRVEELSDQLEALKSNRLEVLPPHYYHHSTSTAELKRLYKELQLKTKGNQDHSNHLQQQRNSLNKRNLEVAAMDQRVAELRQRLWKKKAALQQKENQLVGSVEGAPQHSALSRVAAVGPYIQSIPTSCAQGPPVLDHMECPDSSSPTSATQDSSLKPPPRPVKPASGFITSKIGIQLEWGGLCVESGKGSAQASTLPRMSGLSRQCSGGNFFAILTGAGSPPTVPTQTKNLTENLLMDHQASTKRAVPAGKPKPLSLFRTAAFFMPTYSTGTFPGKVRPAGAQRRPPGLSCNSYTLPLPAKQENPPAAAVRPYTSDLSDPPPTTLQKPQTVATSSIYSMYTQQVAPEKVFQLSGHGTLPCSWPRVYGKPVFPVSGGQQPVDSSNVNSSSCVHDGMELDSSCLGAPETGGGTAECSTPRPLSPTKLLPFLSNPHRIPSDVDLEALRRRLHHAPRPLKKRSSITEPEGPAGPNIQKLLYQKTTLAAMETVPVQTWGNPQLVEDEKFSDGQPLDENQDDNVTLRPLPSRCPVTEPATCRALLPLLEDKEEEAGPPSPAHQEHLTEEFHPYPPTTYPCCAQSKQGADVIHLPPPEVTEQVQVPLGKKSILWQSSSDPQDRSMRVKFNPLVLLLDASLEGEYELVQRVIYDVEDPSTANDEGITALHNAVCAGHTEIVKFLVQFGVNANAADSDGWTPLHCAASCNNVQLCKFLVESGTAVFATTYSDMQTAADKCEEMEDGYAQCSQFLSGVQEKMGVVNHGVVYALWDYEPQNDDELGFSEGDCLTVLSREDEVEKEWWWARCGDNEGYIPRNLLGLYLRIKPRQRSLA